MLKPELVRRRIAEILTAKDAMSLQLEISDLGDSTSFSDDLALDSIQRLEFGIALEEAFGVAIDQNVFDSRLDKFGALVEYICANGAAVRTGG